MQISKRSVRKFLLLNVTRLYATRVPIRANTQSRSNGLDRASSSSAIARSHFLSIRCWKIRVTLTRTPQTARSLQREREGGHGPGVVPYTTGRKSAESPSRDSDRRGIIIAVIMSRVNRGGLRLLSRLYAS